MSTRTLRLAGVIVVAGLALGACGSDDTSSSPDDSVSTDSVRATDPVTTEAPDDDTTTLEDVDQLPTDDDFIDTDFPRASVPPEAIPAAEVLVDATEEELGNALADAQAQDVIVTSTLVHGCILAAVWAVPHPDHLAVQYEDHPYIDCARAFNYDVVFVVPTTGENVHGAWTYETEPSVEAERVVG